MRRLSVSTVLYDGHPVEAALDAIAAAGAGHVEPAFIAGYMDFEEASFTEGAGRDLAARAAAAGLGVHAVSAHADLSAPGAPAMLRRRIAFAEAIGARALVTNAGPAARRAAVRACLDACLPACEAAGLTLALENPGHGSGDLLPDGAAGAAFVAEFDTPALALNYDAGNVHTYACGRVQPAEDFPAGAGSVAHLHLKDVALAPEGWTFCALGEGAIDYAALWPLIPADLPAALELPLRLHRPGRGDPVRRAEPLPLAALDRALRRALAHVARLDGRAGRS